MNVHILEEINLWTLSPGCIKIIRKKKGGDMALAEKNSPYRTAVRSVFFFLMMYYSFYVILTAANGVTMMSKLMVQYVTASYGKAYFGYAMALEFITLPLYFIGALASFAGYRLKELGRRGILFVTIFLMIFIPVHIFMTVILRSKAQETTILLSTFLNALSGSDLMLCLFALIVYFLTRPEIRSQFSR